MPRHPRHIKGQLVVSVKADAFLPHIHRAAARKSLNELPEQLCAPLSAICRDAGTRAASAVAADGEKPVRGRERAVVAALMQSAAASDNPELQGMMVLAIDEGTDADELARRIGSDPVFDFVEAFPTRWPSATLHAAHDPRRNLQWNLRAIDWFRAELPDASDVAVAVLDTGVDASHPQLKQAIRMYDHRGCTAEDVVGHGTHIAGVISARKRHDVPMVGITNCTLDIWKVYGDPKPTDEGVYVDADFYLRALRMIEKSDLRIVNLSLGGTEKSNAERLLFRRLIDKNIVVVAAMGNEGDAGNPVEYPGAYHGVVSVGAIGEDLRRAALSNTGRHIDVMAPGMNILSTVPMKRSRIRSQTDLASANGTSVATAHVAAAVAMMHARHGVRDVADVRERLCRTSARLAQMGDRKRTITEGCGLLNLRNLFGSRDDD
ncbi:MAG TPA: S8 family serine peptidase [Thermoanaerobaculia bacterium]